MKFLLRLISLALIPCQLANPIAAAVVVPAVFSFGAHPNPTLWTEEAVVPWLAGMITFGRNRLSSGHNKVHHDYQTAVDPFLQPTFGQSVFGFEGPRGNQVRRLVDQVESQEQKPRRLSNEELKDIGVFLGQQLRNLSHPAPRILRDGVTTFFVLLFNLEQYLIELPTTVRIRNVDYRVEVKALPDDLPLLIDKSLAWGFTAVEQPTAPANVGTITCYVRNLDDYTAHPEKLQSLIHETMEFLILPQKYPFTPRVIFHAIAFVLEAVVARDGVDSVTADSPSNARRVAVPPRIDEEISLIPEQRQRVSRAAAHLLGDIKAFCEGSKNIEFRNFSAYFQELMIVLMKKGIEPQRPSHALVKSAAVTGAAPEHPVNQVRAKDAIEEMRRRKSAGEQVVIIQNRASQAEDHLLIDDGIKAAEGGLLLVNQDKTRFFWGTDIRQARLAGRQESESSLPAMRRILSESPIIVFVGQSTQLTINIYHPQGKRHLRAEYPHVRIALNAPMEDTWDLSFNKSHRVSRVNGAAYWPKVKDLEGYSFTVYIDKNTLEVKIENIGEKNFMLQWTEPVPTGGSTVFSPGFLGSGTALAYTERFLKVLKTYLDARFVRPSIGKILASA